MRKETRFYDSHVADRISFNLYLEQQHANEPFFVNPIHLEVTFYMPIHKSVDKRKKCIYHTNPPTLDKLYRYLVYCMRGKIFEDDRVICSFSAKKVYDKDPRTEFTITEVA